MLNRKSVPIDWPLDDQGNMRPNGLDLRGFIRGFYFSQSWEQDLSAYQRIARMLLRAYQNRRESHPSYRDGKQLQAYMNWRTEWLQECISRIPTQPVGAVVPDKTVWVRPENAKPAEAASSDWSLWSWMQGFRPFLRGEHNGTTTRTAPGKIRRGAAKARRGAQAP